MAKKIGFEDGKWYRYTKKVRSEDWDPENKMDFCLRGEPLRCNEGEGNWASFHNTPEPNHMWCWDFNNWEETKALVLTN